MSTDAEILQKLKGFHNRFYETQAYAKKITINMARGLRTSHFLVAVDGWFMEGGAPGYTYIKISPSGPNEVRRILESVGVTIICQLNANGDEVK